MALRFRRSSIILICLACAILAVVFLLAGSGSDRQPNSMDLRGAQAFLDLGRRALEAGDADGMIGLFTPSARVLGASPEQMRGLIQTVVHDLQNRHLTAVFRNLAVKSEPGRAYLTFDLDLNEKQKNAEIHYYTNHVNLTLEKTQTSRLLGLVHMQEWRISQLDADPAFDLSTLL